jgi:hypothetical protein
VCLCVCVCMCGFCNVCVFVRVLQCVGVCEGFIMCGCLWGFCNVWVFWEYVYCTLTEVFPCFFLSCKVNARVKLARTGHGTHSSTLVCICVFRLLFVLCNVLFVCKCVLPPGDNQIAVNKYIIIFAQESLRGCIVQWLHVYAARLHVEENQNR